ncbi:GDNF-inducible zinc finger protein 1-like [Ostrinia furnacalis]|uniref:GDNF-inducible zinc finger protein 1-like n=1 Tax=Ostrinia furnacalis TaxID=93504 RepID=UPI00103D37F5|nr:GDNF-inducible zinc finger protein 1-like [Ostrinia furnacalis]
MNHSRELPGQSTSQVDTMWTANQRSTTWVINHSWSHRQPRSSVIGQQGSHIHKRTHSDDRPCKCEECGREFRQWSDLKYHKTSIHSDQKHFKCEFCGKEFARKYSLNLHRRIHTGERNYKCEYCSKSFRASSYRLSHMRTHTGECSLYVGRMRVSPLASTRCTSTGERNYKCEYCSKSFRASSYRLSHMRTHTGDRPYKCNECEKCFRVAGDLRRHTLTHDKSRARLRDKPRARDPKPEPKPDVKLESADPTPTPATPAKTFKKVALASTTRLPTILKVEKKQPRLKKNPVNKKGGAPNVTVAKNDTFKIAENNEIEVFELRQPSHYKEMYDPGEYSKCMYKDSERVSDDRDVMFRNVCDVEKPYRSENTDGKMQIYTHVDKSKDYSGPVISSSVSLGDIRHLERELAREVRHDGLHGETIENGFLDRLTALYNISAV